MPLSVGTRLGPYEVLSPLGAGGMGEVYRARDAKLGREVALKVLPDEVANDPDRLKRFEREARTLAALNHPHIAQVYGFEDAGAVHALVMELVPGESLAARLARGPLPWRDALELARQIADGLHAAHDKGIVHRDLKPANVQVTPDEQVKILDFGLAKALVPEAPASVTDSPTVTAGTRHGVILGTAPYMSPEQARGVPVDARTDIWAFGGLLYEMLAGARAFPGETATDALAAILEREPVWTALPAATPPAIRRLLQRCLKKDPRHRLHHIADAGFTIEEALAAPTAMSGAGVDTDGTGAPAPPPPPARAVWRHPLPLGLALLTMAFGSAFVWSVSRAPATAVKGPLYFSIMLPPDQASMGGDLALSPNGRDLVYGAVSEEGEPGPVGDVGRLYHRRLSEPAARALPGTENALEPFFSPDGQSVAFISSSDLKLRTISLSGGGPVEGAPIPWFEGPGSWTATGSFLLGDTVGPIRRVPVSGGNPEIVVPREALEPNEQGAIRPAQVPGGTAILFVSVLGVQGSGKLAVWDGTKRRTLLTGVLAFRLLGSDQLVYWRRASGVQLDLCVVPFDPVRTEVKGEPVVLLSEPRASSLALSEEGTLVYMKREGGGSIEFSWLPTGGRQAPPAFGPLPSSGVASFRVSPEGRRVLYSQEIGSSDRRLVVADLTTRTTRTLVSGAVSGWNIWMPDGRRVVYQVGPDDPGGAGLLLKPVDGSGSAERVTWSKVWQQPQVVTRDGRFLVYQEGGGIATRNASVADNYDLWVLPLAPRGTPRPLLRTAANERMPHLSPDDRWMAYVSDESGRDEVCVRAFPDGASSVQVSQDGGTEPLWAPDGRTLYYRDWSGTMLYAVPVTQGAVPQFGTPVMTRGDWSPCTAWGRRYDVDTTSGALLFQHGTTARNREIRVVLHLDELIRWKLAEAKK